MEALEARFWGQVDRREDYECWPWTAGTDGRGYGQFWLSLGELDLGPKRVKAHRVAFRLIQGRWPMPQGLHGCDNPLCCNALNSAHVHEGTQRLNVHEMHVRDRQGGHLAGGVHNPAAKLTVEQVQVLRLRRSAGAKQAVLSAEFGISQSAVSEIVRGLRYV